MVIEYEQSQRSGANAAAELRRGRCNEWELIVGSLDEDHINTLQPNPVSDVIACRTSDADGMTESTRVYDIDCDRRFEREPSDQLRDRLVARIDESNNAQGYIKEPCWSRDGRLLASPYAHGLRLLAFDPQCSTADERIGVLLGECRKEDQVWSASTMCEVSI